MTLKFLINCSDRFPKGQKSAIVALLYESVNPAAPDVFDFGGRLPVASDGKYLDIILDSNPSFKKQSESCDKDSKIESSYFEVYEKQILQRLEHSALMK